MRWFGESWYAPVNKATEHEQTPLGATCPYCEKLIRAGDQGLLLPYLTGANAWDWQAWHIDCFTESVGVR